MKKLAILLPGIGYTADRPLLRFAMLLAREQGCEVLSLRWQGAPDKALPNEERLARFRAGALEEARAALRALPLEDYDAFYLLAKSIGTAVAADLLPCLPAGKRVKTVLFTPVEAALSGPIPNAVAFTGTADPWVAPGAIPELCRTRGIPCHVFDGADHSLECPDTFRTLDNLRVCIETVERFLCESYEL